MAKHLVEFINVCAWCDPYSTLVQELAKKYEDLVEVKVYKAGKDFDYIRKYGLMSKSVLIIDESQVVENLNKKVIEVAFSQLMGRE